MMRLIWSTCLAARLASGSGPENSGPEPDHSAGGSPYNPLPYGHPYPGLGPHLGPFPNEQIKIVYVEKPVEHTQHSLHHRPHYHPEPAPYRGEPAPASYHPEPTYRPEEPKANCTLDEVKKEEMVCGPGKPDKDCKPIEVKYMKISTEEQCYEVTRTVCSESVVEEDREICKYEFKHASRQEQATGVDVTFNKTKKSKGVEICNKVPVRGYGYVKTYENVCHDAIQTTETVSPSVSSRDFPVAISGPEIVRTCITKRMKIPMVDCKDVTENKCTMAPMLVDAVEELEICEYNLGKEECRESKLYLPIQTCTDKTEEKSGYHTTA
jgi:hypothetical protein